MIFKRNTLFILILIILLICTVLIVPRAKKEKGQISKKKESIAKAVAKAKVAIVIDDLGYNLNNLDLIYSIKNPLTLSVLPNLPYSRRISSEAAEKGYEIILHLPLESSEEEAPMEVNTIRVDMAKIDVLKALDMAIDDVSVLTGVSNHMGSKATKDRALMRIIFKELERKKLYFLDSLVTGESVCEEVAKDVGMRFAKRDVYLDNIGEADYIKNQFKLLMKHAKKTGSSIGIGHDRNLTIKVLAEEIPEFEKEEIEFVFVSELLKEY